MATVDGSGTDSLEGRKSEDGERSERNEVKEFGCHCDFAKQRAWIGNECVLERYDL